MDMAGEYPLVAFFQPRPLRRPGLSTKSRSTALEERLDVRFQDSGILQQALTHSSAKRAPDNNERLEFLGDRVLGLVIAELLSEAFPDAEEGELAKRYNALVRRETCAEVARAIDLGRYIHLGSGQEGQDGRDNISILGNACEALLGAVFLDQGYDAVRAVIRREWSPLLDVGEAAVRDPKSALQEWAQSRGLALPRYEVVSATGPDHAPEFTIEVVIDGMEPARALGRSKRSAEQAAAQLMLDREEIANSVKP